MSELSVGIVVLGTPECNGGDAPLLPSCVEVETLAYPEFVERGFAHDASSAGVAIVDARGLASENAAEILRDAVQRLHESQWLVVALLDDAAAALGPDAVDAGAWDVLYARELRVLPERVRAAARVAVLRRAASELRPNADALAAEDPDTAEPLQMVGTSEPMRRVFALIRRVSAFDVPVLMTGESGTGKELAAIAIHERSARASGPLVTINCGAIPENLLESELFGYEKGAFTGASQSRKGRFEAADGGTVFLDEVGELAPSLQVKLLRFLQDHVIERIGGRGGFALDVRVLAATNRDLQAMVDAGSFREDLYFRLAVLTIEMPPLHARGDDIVLMAQYFLRRYAREAKQAPRAYARETIEAMRRHPWPGNVRELINRVRRAIVLAEGSLILPSDLGLSAPDHVPAVVTLRDARRKAEVACLRAALERAAGNKVEAARLLGISRTQLYELLHRNRVESHGHAWM